MSKQVYSTANIKGAIKNLTLDGLLETYYDFLANHPTIVKEMKCAPDTFRRLNDYFAQEQAEREAEGIKSIPPEQVWLSTLYGMKVVVDPDMKPGTWKFVPISLDSPFQEGR